MIKEQEKYAFPSQDSAAFYKGMTLRDWFAGQALVGIVNEEGQTYHSTKIAKKAYIIADEMLEARDRKKDE